MKRRAPSARAKKQRAVRRDSPLEEDDTEDGDMREGRAEEEEDDDPDFEPPKAFKKQKTGSRSSPASTLVTILNTEPQGRGDILSLPAEMLLLVFSLLPERRFVHLANCALVCRRWYHIANDDQLWRHLDASLYPNTLTAKRITDLWLRRSRTPTLGVVLKSQEEDGRSFTKRLDEIISLMKVAGASVTRLYVELDPVKSVHATALLARIAQRCDNLRELTLCVTFPVHSAKDSIVRAALLAHVLPHWPQLRVLKIRGSFGCDPPVIDLDRFPHLEEITVHDLRVGSDTIKAHWHSSLGKLRLVEHPSVACTPAAVPILRHCSRLTNLRLDSLTYTALVSDDPSSAATDETLHSTLSDHDSEEWLDPIEEVWKRDTGAAERATTQQQHRTPAPAPPLRPCQFPHVRKLHIDALSPSPSLTNTFPELRALTVSVSSRSTALASFLQSCTALEQLRLLVVSQQVAHVRVLVTHRPPALRSIELSSFKLDRLLEIHHDMLTFAADVKRSVAQHRVTGTETLVPQEDRISIELLGRLISNQPAGLRRLVLGGTTCTLHSDDGHQAGLGRTAVCAQCGVALNAETTPTTKTKNKTKTAMTSSQPNMPTAGAKSEAGRSEPRKLPASWREGGGRGRGKQDAPKSRSRDTTPKKSAAMRKGKAALVAADSLDDEVEDIDTTDDDDVEDEDEQREVSRAEPQQQQAPWNGFTRHKSFSFAVVPKEVATTGGSGQRSKRGPGATSASAPVATTGPNSIIMTRGKVPVSVRCLWCGQARYCSVECEREGWATTHRTRCPAILLMDLLKKATTLQVLQMSRVALRVMAVTSAHLQCLVLTHTSIRTLRLNCPSLRSLVFSANEQTREVVLEGCSSLAVLVVLNCPRLVSLDLSSPASRGSSSGDDSGGVERLVLDTCQALARVTLPGTTSRRLRLVSVSVCLSLTAIEGADWSRLWVFDAVHTTDLRLPTTASAQPATDREWRVPNLISLDLTRNKISDNNAVRLVAPRLIALRANHSAIGDQFLARIVAPALKCVSLAGCGGVSASGIAHLLAAAPELSQLDLSGCSRLTTADLVRVFTPSAATAATRRALRVRLSGCSSLNDAEAREKLGKLVKLQLTADLWVGPQCGFSF